MIEMIGWMNISFSFLVLNEQTVVDKKSPKSYYFLLSLVAALILFKVSFVWFNFLRGAQCQKYAVGRYRAVSRKMTESFNTKNVSTLKREDRYV